MKFAFCGQICQVYLYNDSTAGELPATPWPPGMPGEKAYCGKAGRMNIWILGSGTFGARAVRQLAKSHDARGITLVDPSQQALADANVPGIKTVCQDGVAFVVKHLRAQGAPDWIVPALPVHLVWEWAVCRLAGLERLALPDTLVSSLPNAMTGESGDVYVSHADFICPLNCSEPDDICTRTGQPRKQDMFRLLEGKGCKELPFFVVQSVQLGPGLGGYQPQALLELKEQLKPVTGAFAVATACRCHGVVTGGHQGT